MVFNLFIFQYLCVSARAHCVRACVRACTHAYNMLSNVPNYLRHFIQAITQMTYPIPCDIKNA